MSELSSGFKERVRGWYRDGTLYPIGGILTVFIAWALLPPFGLLSPWLGYRTHEACGRTLLGGLIAGLGGFAVLIWLGLLFL